MTRESCQVSGDRCHMTGARCQVPHVTCHLSPVICDMTPVTYHLLPVTCHLHSNLHGIGYCPSRLFTKIESHVQTIPDLIFILSGLDFKIQICLFLHHISENPI